MRVLLVALLLVTNHCRPDCPQPEPTPIPIPRPTPTPGGSNG